MIIDNPPENEINPIQLDDEVEEQVKKNIPKKKQPKIKKKGFSRKNKIYPIVIDDESDNIDQLHSSSWAQYHPFSLPVTFSINSPFALAVNQNQPLLYQNSLLQSKIVSSVNIGFFAHLPHQTHIGGQIRSTIKACGQCLGKIATLKNLYHAALDLKEGLYPLPHREVLHCINSSMVADANCHILLRLSNWTKKIPNIQFHILDQYANNVLTYPNAKRLLSYYAGHGDLHGSNGDIDGFDEELANSGDTNEALYFRDLKAPLSQPVTWSCPNKHGEQFVLWKCRFCCNLSTFFCWGSTHFCQNCHDRQVMFNMAQKPSIYSAIHLPQCRNALFFESNLFENQNFCKLIYNYKSD